MQRRTARFLEAFLVLCLLMTTIWPNAAAAPSAGEARESSSMVLKHVTLSGDAQAADYGGKRSVYAIRGTATLRGEIQVETAGRYRMMISYCLDDANKSKVEFSGKIGDSAAPYSLTVPRVFEDEFAVDGEMRPAQLAVCDWLTAEARLDDYRRGEYAYFDFARGKNTIELTFQDQYLWIESLYLLNEPEILSFEGDGPAPGEAATITLEAEHAYRKSVSSLPPTYDIANAIVSPYRYDKSLLNTIGGAAWNTPGQWIEWAIPVETAGYYQISLRVRQNTSRGLNSYRRITVDGKLPFASWDAYSFGYERKWYVETLKNDAEETAYIWLDKGTHYLRMEAVMGDALESYRVITNAVEQLNSIYRKIVMITGPSPDANRSYQLYKRLPIKEELLELAKILEDELNRVEAGQSGTELSVLSQTATQLRNYAHDESRLIKNLAVFNSDITALAAQLSVLANQPLQMDLIQAAGNTDNLPEDKIGFWDTIKNSFLRFFHSFVKDYASIDTVEKGNGNLTVWIMTGRDQSQVLKDMINDSFTPKTGLSVRLSLTTAGFNEAVMSGRGPDVCIGTERTNVINLGVRGALYDLSAFYDFEEVRSRFQKTAFNGYTYDNKVYALPDTQEYNMMFVRTDIYDELGLEIPQTWAQLQEQIAILSRYNMQAGITSALYTTMLLQNGMTYYTEDLKSTVFGTLEAYQVYTEFAKFFSDYEVPISFNAQNRFRSGEMPILISPFSFYNTFSLLAPELNGKWAMYGIPGTADKHGGLNRSTEATGTASVIAADTTQPENAFAFLKWWSSNESQSRFCREIEDILGPSGRYSTANVEAFETTNWSAEQRKIIQTQRESVWEIPETPFSYIISRNLTNLFVNVVNNDADIRESLLRYERIMQSEIDRKYEELALYKGE